MCRGGLVQETSLQIIDVAVRIKSRVRSSSLLAGAFKVGDVEPNTNDPLEILKCRFCAYDLWTGVIALGRIPPLGLGLGDSPRGRLVNGRE